MNSNRKLRTVFFGSSDYCLPIAKTLYGKSDLLCLVTRPDRPIGRKKILTPSPIRIFGDENRVNVMTPENRKGLSDIRNTLFGMEPDFLVVADYGMIIPGDYFDESVNRNNIINIHFSKLPDLRGASPVQFTILRGDKTAWITWQVMDEGMDTGDVIRSIETPLRGDETAGNLYPKLFEAAADITMDILGKLETGDLRPIKQNENYATHTKLISKEDGYVPWEVFHASLDGADCHSDLFIIKKFLISDLKFQIDVPNAVLIERMTRAFDPWPGVWTNIKIKNMGTRLKILKGHTEENKNPEIRVQVSEKRIVFVPEIVQLEGKKPVKWEEFRKYYLESRIKNQS